MGGLLAGWLARHYPEVKKLVLLSTAVNAMEWPQLVENSKQVLTEAKEVTLKNSPMFKTLSKESNGKRLGLPRYNSKKW